MSENSTMSTGIFWRNVKNCDLLFLDVFLKLFSLEEGHKLNIARHGVVVSKLTPNEDRIHNSSNGLVYDTSLP